MNTLSPARQRLHHHRRLADAGATPPAIRKTIDGDGASGFERALGRTNRVPANVILMPMEGDPAAPGAFWTLARRTNGSFLMPARDWP
jgi:hypothetical protein